MSRLTDHADALAGVGELTADSRLELLHGSMPVLATPVAVAAGVGVAAALGAGAAGYAAEEAADS